MKKALLFEKKEGKIKCLACSHYCLLGNGKVGICGVRKNINGELYLLVYGKPVSMNVDPIEKKPLFHFLPGSKALSLGTFGCNFACDFCQNWDISQPPKEIRFKEEHDRLFGNLLENLRYFSPEEIVDYAVNNEIEVIAYTYNEPAVFFEYAYDIAKLASKKGIRNVFVSNGYSSKEAISKIKRYLDGINIDLKSFSEEFYNKLCKARLEPVLDSIKRIYKFGIWLELTTLVIPERNDSEEELRKIAEFIASIDKDIPWHISAFYPAYKMLNINATPLDTLMRAYKIGKEAGLRYVYVGNIYGNKYESTYCFNCGKNIIKRVGFSVVSNNIENGKCRFCNKEIKGVWK
jgi:pyruvate formate lyase activating enzyme